jgi:excisionase family DNA binding protein
MHLVTRDGLSEGRPTITYMDTKPEQSPGLPRHPSIAQVALWHNVSTKTVRRWLAEGRIKGYRLGDRLIRIDRESALALGRPVGAAR